MTSIRTIRCAAVLVGLAVALGSCDGGPLSIREATDHAAALGRWERSAPPDYSFTFVRGCFCPYEGPMRVTVRADTVHSVVLLAPPGWLPPGYEPEGITIPALFDLIARALRSDRSRATVRYDRELGFPVEAFVDWYLDAVDDEVGYSVTDLVFETLR